MIKPAQNHGSRRIRGKHLVLIYVLMYAVHLDMTGLAGHLRAAIQINKLVAVFQKVQHGNGHSGKQHDCRNVECDGMKICRINTRS